MVAGLTRSTRGKRHPKDRAGAQVPSDAADRHEHARGNEAGKCSHLISHWLTGGYPGNRPGTICDQQTPAGAATGESRVPAQAARRHLGGTPGKQVPPGMRHLPKLATSTLARRLLTGTCAAC
jgi:hypothetical protein